MSDIVEILKADYSHFPTDQTYSIYAEDVYFQDPINQFKGIQRYQNMIQSMTTWFRDLHLDLHEIKQTGSHIQTQWTLSWNVPLPWQPRLRVDGWTQMEINAQGKIQSHIDYWKCSRADVFKQLWMIRS